jgi:hypothetical protein
MKSLEIGMCLRKKEIRDIVQLSNGWYIVKTENGKSAKDFRVKTVFTITPRARYLTPKHAHFVIDFYGKLCANKEKAAKILEAIIDIWNKKPVTIVLDKYKEVAEELPGYKLEYILYALNWILDQEDVNFTGRPEKRQAEIDDIFHRCNVTPPSERKGSQLAMSLFCNVFLGLHPVDAFIKANLDVLPVKRARGTV